LLLAKLARFRGKKQSGNSPQDALRGIFLAWLPQTMATVETRFEVIDLLRKREPSITWELLTKLLPEHYSTASPSVKPRWREWYTDGDAVTRREMFAVHRGVLERMLSDVGQDGARWEDVIAALPVVPNDYAEAIHQRLDELAVTDLLADDRKRIWHGLRSLLSRHRSFPDANWALPAARLERLSALFEKFTPDDLIARSAWLFSDHVELPEGREQDWPHRDAIIANQRLDAIKTIYAIQGLKGILALLPVVSRSYWVGVALGSTDLADEGEVELLARYLGAQSAAEADFARGVVVGRQQGRCRRSMRCAS
jgi:hypothetical protein